MTISKSHEFLLALEARVAPDSGARHALVCVTHCGEERIAVAMKVGGVYRSCVLAESDLRKTPATLAQQVALTLVGPKRTRVPAGS